MTDWLEIAKIVFDIVDCIDIQLQSFKVVFSTWPYNANLFEKANFMVKRYLDFVPLQLYNEYRLKK